MLRIILFLSLMTLFSCNENKQESNVYYNTIIQEYKEKGISDISTIKNPEEIKAILNVFKALEYQRQHDSLNEVSTSLLLESVDIVNNSANIGLREWVYSEIGFYYYTYNHYIEAAPYFIKISKVIDNNLEQIDVQRCNVLLKTAYFFETIQQYDKCIDYYKKTLETSCKTNKNKGAVLWALGAAYQKIDSIASAKEYYTLASEQALKVGDTLRYAKSLGGLASILEIEGDKTTAEQYYVEDINISKRLKEDRNQMYAQIQLGKFYYANKQYTLAEQVWQEAYEITKTRDYLMGYQREVSAHLLNIAKVSHRDGEELFYRRELDRIDNIIEDRESEDVIRKINWNTSYESITWELEAERNANDRVRYQRLLFMSSTGLLLLLVVVIYFFYKRIIKLQTFKYEAKLLAFQYSKLSSETKLKDTHASLASYQVYLSEKTQQIERLEQELEKVKYSTNEYVKEKRPDLEQLLNAHLMTDESWNMFKETFKEEQEEYYLYLMERFPDLTESNLRIVLLQKLGLTNQETANLLGITIDAVKKAKQRLKKKYEEEYDTILNPDKEEV